MKRQGPGLYLEADAGPQIAVVLVREDGGEERLPPVTPAEDLLAALAVDYSGYRQAVSQLREEHPLFEERAEVSVADLEDLAVEVVLLPSLLKETDPVAWFLLGVQLDAALRAPDDGSAAFPLNAGQLLLRVLEQPILTQIRLRNIFETTFDGMERATQRERFARLRDTYPEAAVPFFLSRPMETPAGELPFDGRTEYALHSQYELRLLELSLYFHQRTQRIARCEYCWAYFIPKTKKETLYCDRAGGDKTCKQLGPNLKRYLGPEQDAVLRCYRTLRSRMAARMERYQAAADWERKNLIPMDLFQYTDWSEAASEARMRYLRKELTDEEFLRGIDPGGELNIELVDQVESSDQTQSDFQRMVRGDIDFDPEWHYEPVQFLDLGTPAPHWQTISAAEQKKADRQGRESLSEKFGKGRPRGKEDTP